MYRLYISATISEWMVELLALQRHPFISKATKNSNKAHPLSFYYISMQTLTCLEIWKTAEKKQSLFIQSFSLFFSSYFLFAPHWFSLMGLMVSRHHRSLAGQSSCVRRGRSLWCCGWRRSHAKTHIHPFSLAPAPFVTTLWFNIWMQHVQVPISAPFLSVL